MMKFILSKVSEFVRISFTGKFAVVTNTVSGAFLFILGDLIEQKGENAFIKKISYSSDDNVVVVVGGAGAEEPAASIDKERVGRIGIIGLLEAPPHYYFYKYLDKHLPGRSLATIGKKIFLDQMIACPMFSFQFFVGMALLEGKGIKLAWNEFIHKFPTVYMVDWLLWPPCQLVNFLFVPGRYRVLYVNSVTVAWNVFLSYMKHYDQEKIKTKTF